MNFNINDKIKYKNKIGIIKNIQYLYHLDKFIYLIEFNNIDDYEIVIDESYLERIL